MKSLDTNLLFYAINSEAPEHPRANRLVKNALDQPTDWILADQVWFELYRLLRNPTTTKRPLTATEADSTIDYYRNRSGWGRCAWEPATMMKLRTDWRADDFPPRRTFDLVLAHTLKANGVTEFFTRNIRDFESYGFFKVTDPLA